MTTITISRSPQQVGDTELITFRRICRVPSGARRIPPEGQGEHDGRYYVAFRWTDGGGDDRPHP